MANQTETTVSVFSILARKRNHAVPKETKAYLRQASQHATGHAHQPSGEENPQEERSLDQSDPASIPRVEERRQAVVGKNQNCKKPQLLVGRTLRTQRGSSNPTWCPNSRFATIKAAGCWVTSSLPKRQRPFSADSTPKAPSRCRNTLT